MVSEGEGLLQRRAEETGDVLEGVRRRVGTMCPDAAVVGNYKM